MASSTSAWSLPHGTTGKYLLSVIAAREVCNLSITSLLAERTSLEKLRIAKNAYHMLLDTTGKPTPAHITRLFADIEKRQVLAAQVREYLKGIPENQPGREYYVIRLNAALSMSDDSFSSKLVRLLMKQEAWTFDPTL
jgi:hypothetical protein